MEHGAVETEIGPSESDLDQAATVAHALGRVVPRIDPVDDQIRASIADPSVVLRIQTPVVRFCHLSLPR